MNSPNLPPVQLIRAMRRLLKVRGRPAQQHAARRALVLFDRQYPMPPDELLVMREVFERKLPSHVRAHRRLVRVMRHLGFNHWAFRRLGPEWHTPLSSTWVVAHTSFTTFLLGQTVIQLGTAVTWELQSVLECFRQAQALTGGPRR